jgi:hypothetical protein
MGMVELNDLLPSSQWELNWTFFGNEHVGLPHDATYVVFEYYCDKPSCDCQSLTASIMKLGDDGGPIKKNLAVVNYDWSSQASQCVPTLDEQSPRTAMALHLLEVYKKFVHHPDYLARIKNQYARVKQIASKKELKKQSSQQKISVNPSIGRNDPCPCGSNKKYKKCCLSTELSRDI